MQHPFDQFLRIGVLLRYLSPQEHPHLCPVETAAQQCQYLFGQDTPPAIDLYVIPPMPFIRIRPHGLRRSQLYAPESSRIDVALHFQYPRDESRIADAHPHTPSRHIVSLRHGIELYAAVFGTGHLQQAQLLSLVEDKRVRIVVDNHDSMPAGKVDQPDIGLPAGVTAGRHVRIIRPHQADTAQIHPLQCVEIGLPSPFLPQVVGHDLCSEQPGEGCVGGITGIRDKHLFAGIDKGQGDVQDTFLRSDKRLYLGQRIHLHAIPVFIEVGHRPAQFGCAHGGLIAMPCRLPGDLAELVNGLLRGRLVGTADSQGDDVLSFRIQFCHFFQFAREVVLLHLPYTACRLYHRLFPFHLLFMFCLPGHFPRADGC